jgi:hypothetical protein
MIGQRLDSWCWLATASFLTVSLAGYTPALGFAIGVVAIRVLHLVVRTRSMSAFPVQVHAAYLLLLAVGSSSTLAFIHWNLLVGTWAFIITNYCILARCLALLPWNRSGPLTWSGIGHTLISRPVTNILQTDCGMRAQGSVTPR